MLTLIPESTTKHENNLSWLSDCLEFSFDIWRKTKTINSETDLGDGKLYHPLRWAARRNPTLSEQS